MANEDQTNLAPTGIYGRSDEEQQNGTRILRRKTDKSPGNCLVYSLTIIVIVFAVSLILSLIFLRVSIPEIDTDQIKTTDLRFNTNSSNPFFNATLVSEISIRNSNFGDFEYGNSSLKFVYGNHGVVGETVISGGRISAHKTVRLTGIMVQIGSFRLLNSDGLDSDLRTGFLKLNSVAEVIGSVNVLGKKRWKLSVMSCTMNLNFSNRLVQNLLCP